MSAADPRTKPADAPEHEAAPGDGDPVAGSAPAGEAAEPRATGGEGEDLEALERERDEYLELAKRTRADFDNFRKRAAREATDAELRGRFGLAKELVPILDNLERALAAAESAPEGLVQGVELVYRELREALARAGVEAYDPIGESFDPAWHEAVATRPADGAGPGTVVETLAKGYRLDDRVLRAAKVVVGE